MSRSYFLVSRVINELEIIFFLKEQNSQSYLFQTEQNFAAHKTLGWSAYVWRTATATFFFFFSKKVIYELGSHFNENRFI